MFILSSPTELSAVPTAVPDRTSTHQKMGLAAVLVTLAVPVILAGPVAAVVGAHVIAAAAAVVDVRSRRIPNRLVVLVVVAAALGVVAASSPGDAASDAVLGAVGLGGPMLLIHLLSPASIGFGDVKLGAALGAVLGPLGPTLALVALCLASGATAVVGLSTRRRELPLGPGLVIGSAVAAALSGNSWS